MTAINPEKRRFRKILDLIPKNKKIKIIEIGCEYGPITNFLSSRGYNVLGTDLNPEAITLAKKRYPSAKYEVKDLWEIDFSKYDVIVAFGVFEYIFNLRALLKKLEREMKRGCILVFSVPNVCSFSKRIRTFCGKNPNREIKVPALAYSFEDIEKIIKHLSFSDKKITTTYCDGIKNLYFPTPKGLSGQIIVRLIK